MRTGDFYALENEITKLFFTIGKKIKCIQAKLVRIPEFHLLLNVFDMIVNGTYTKV